MQKQRSNGEINLVKLSQFLLWPIAYIFFAPLYNIRIQGRENLKNISNPFIIISNHFNYSVSLLFRLVVGFFPPHLPYRFIAVNKFNRKWLVFLSNAGIIPFVYKIFGVIIVTPGLGIQKNLEEARRVLAQGGNIVIYPEGGIVDEYTIAPFKKGAAVLATETGAPTLPVSFCLGKRKFVRRDLHINIGEPVRVLPDTHPDETTKMFHKTITGLFHQHLNR